MVFTTLTACPGPAKQAGRKKIAADPTLVSRSPLGKISPPLPSGGNPGQQLGGWGGGAGVRAHIKMLMPPADLPEMDNRPVTSEGSCHSGQEVGVRLLQTLPPHPRILFHSVTPSSYLLILPLACPPVLPDCSAVSHLPPELISPFPHIAPVMPPLSPSGVGWRSRPSVMVWLGPGETGPIHSVHAFTLLKSHLNPFY